MSHKNECPTCQCRTYLIYKCKRCGKLACDSCMISIYCVDCYMEVQKDAEISRYFKEKYKGVPNEV